MHKIGVIIAMDKELELFSSSINNMQKEELHQRCYYQGKSHNKELTVVVSGIGKVNAAVCTSDLINHFHCDFIINIGISGGLDANLQIGDFVVGDDITYHDVWCWDENKYGQVPGMPECYHSAPEISALFKDLKHGLLCCGDKFIVTAEELNQIKQLFPQALAVDMESAAIAQTCYLHNISFISIRQISDTPGIKHHAEQYEEFWKNAPQHSVSMLNRLLEKI